MAAAVVVAFSPVEFIEPDRYCETHALAQYVGGIIMTDIACPPSPLFFYRPRLVIVLYTRQV